MVYHSSGALAGKTINYGEVNPGTYGNLRVGSLVKQGDTIGTFSRCGMLHMELYSGRQSQNYAWYPSGGRVVGSNFNGCARNSINSKPRVLLDPRPLIQATKPANARFHGGTSFLNDDGDATLAEAEASIPDAASGLDGTDGDAPDAGLVYYLLFLFLLFFCCVKEFLYFRLLPSLLVRFCSLRSSSVWRCSLSLVDVPLSAISLR